MDDDQYSQISGRPVEFHFVLNIIKSSYESQVFDEIKLSTKNSKLLSFNWGICEVLGTGCTYIVLLEFA